MVHRKHRVFSRWVPVCVCAELYRMELLNLPDDILRLFLELSNLRDKMAACLASRRCDAHMQRLLTQRQGSILPCFMETSYRSSFDAVLIHVFEQALASWLDLHVAGGAQVAHAPTARPLHPRRG